MQMLYVMLIYFVAFVSSLLLPNICLIIYLNNEQDLCIYICSLINAMRSLPS